MKTHFQQAVSAGAQRMAAWAELLDSINIFPVPDADTGRNLAFSLMPLRHIRSSAQDTIRQMQKSACGNSGNIAAHFFSEFLGFEVSRSISYCAQKGRDKAWKAVSNPLPGTMLTVFDALADIPESHFLESVQNAVPIIGILEKAVRSTPDLLPELKAAGVVDSGALAMFIFFEGFFQHLSGQTQSWIPVNQRFKDYLTLSEDYSRISPKGHCISAVLRPLDAPDRAISHISEWGDSLVASSDAGAVTLHLHTENMEGFREKLETLGRIESWSDQNMEDESLHTCPQKQAIHIMSDAAGSLTRKEARRLGITLLDSYILLEDRSVAETLCDPAAVYPAMKAGKKISTAQASVFERHQHYQSAVSLHDRVLYLCVGSVYTGNYETAVSWKATNDPEDRFVVTDTGAASGRLGLIAIAAARCSAEKEDAQAVIDFAQRAVGLCEEYIFLDKLHYLAAGGRLSKTGAFFGDMLKLKPVISPLPQGPVKAGMVRDTRSQLDFALEKLSVLKKNAAHLILLEYTDNRGWVESAAADAVGTLLPESEILLQPMSLTSGVHMGPGTWAVAFLPESARTGKS
jgi:DegV family protein with EDD domain